MTMAEVCTGSGFQPATVRARPCLGVVGDARKPLAQLDRGREFAPLLIDGADRCGLSLGDDEHRWSMGRRVLVG